PQGHTRPRGPPEAAMPSLALEWTRVPARGGKVADPDAGSPSGALDEAVLALRDGSALPRNAGRLGQRGLDVGEDRPLRPRRHDRLGEAVDMHVGATPLAPL